MGLVRTPIHIHVWCMRDDGKLNLRERDSNTGVSHDTRLTIHQEETTEIGLKS